MCGYVVHLQIALQGILYTSFLFSLEGAHKQIIIFFPDL